MVSFAEHAQNGAGFQGVPASMAAREGAPFCALKAAVAALSCLGFVCACAAPATAAAPDITFTASGTFAAPAVSGNDELRLAGEPFTISVVANAAAVPVKHGPSWAVFSPLKMTGVVHSGLLGPTPVSIASGATSIEQLVTPAYDLVVIAFPVNIVGINLTVQANVTMPPSTIPNQLIHIFAPVSLSPSTATVTYSQGTQSTMLAVERGTLSAAVSSSSLGRSRAIHIASFQNE